MTRFCIQIFSSYSSKQTIMKKWRTEAGEKPKLADPLPTCFLFWSVSCRRPDFLLIQRPVFTYSTHSKCQKNQSKTVSLWWTKNNRPKLWIIWIQSKNLSGKTASCSLSALFLIANTMCLLLPAIFWSATTDFLPVVVTNSWEFCLSMRQISLRERVEIAWFTRDIWKSYNKHGSQAFSVD